MKKIKIFLQCFLAVAVFLLAAKFAQADGIAVHPPDRMVYETDQKAVIFFDEGKEHLFLSISFVGNADDFAWIVPTPTKPEVEKSTDLLFSRLDELTRPDYPMTEREYYSPLAGGVQDVGKSVTVHEQKKIEYYDITVLEATDDEALYNWLNDHGYSFPRAGKHITNEYIKNGWFFTAVKIDDERFSAVGAAQMKNGNATPLKLSFETENIVYPMKISSIMGMEDDAPEGEVTFVEGAVGKGVKLDTGRILATDAVVKGFDVTDGKVSFSLKKRDSKPLSDVLRIEKTSPDKRKKEGFRVSNSIGNTYVFYLFYPGGQSSYSVDLGSDFKVNEWQKFEFEWELNPRDNKRYLTKFFVDGVQRTLNDMGGFSQTGISSGVTDQDAVLSVGGFVIKYSTSQVTPGGPVRQDSVVSHQGDLLVDEIGVFGSQEKIFEADFREQLKVKLLNDQENQLRVFTRTNAYSPTIQKPESMGVLLYIFAQKGHEVPGFDLQYAGPIEKAEIENIAKADGKTPWFSPSKEKYFLTRHYKHMPIAEMTNDIYPTESKELGSYNYAGSEKAKIIWVVVLIVLSFGSLAAMIWFVLKNEKKKGAKEGAKEPEKQKEEENKEDHQDDQH